MSVLNDTTNLRRAKPDWLKTRLPAGGKFAATRSLLQTYGLNTICSSGNCPNRTECWSRGTATLMICGDICTRCCKFCNTAVGKPFPLDAAEPQKIAETVKILGLKYVVLTSVDRDDLPDLGATHWVKTIEKVRSLNPDTRIEALIPDFQGNEQWIAAVCRQKPYIVGHNMETVRRLTPSVRSAARYDISLQVLRLICTYGCTAKTGIMAGLGETVEEIEETMDDILATGCLRLTIGQYLQPSSSHLPVQKYYTPDEYDEFRRIALGKGFTRVDSGALVRSSYHAEE